MRWRHSLFVRLFGVGALIALTAVAAATWATVRATTVAVQAEQRESLHADAQTYDALVGYAATHRSWSDAGAFLARLSRAHGGPLTLTDTSGHPLAGAAGTRAVLPASTARARIDPLDVDTSLLGAGGPTPSSGQPSLDASPVPPADSATEPSECVGDVVPGVCALRVVTTTLALDPRVVGPFAGPGRAAATAALRDQVDDCLRTSGNRAVTAVRRDLAVLVPRDEDATAVATCLDTALRTALTPYVAPPVLLHVADRGASARVFWDLSGSSQRRIALLAGAVLLATLLLCALLATTLVRPLRRMASAATRAESGDLTARVPVSRRDEIGEVATAFNAMAERRQALEEARTRMVSDVSHELRTPLANVRGWLEAAQDGLADTDARLIDSLHEETLQLQRLVNDLHDVSLGDAGELRLHVEVLDATDHLAKVADGFASTAAAAGVTLRVDVRPGVPLHGDPVRLRQALGNLMANAIRHTPRGGRVTVRSHRAGVIEVIDTGDGIPAADLPHVFERFRRTDTSRSRDTGGSGLGLAIVRQVVEAHGGTAEIDSTEGAGTTVTLRLPTPPTDPGGLPDGAVRAERSSVRG